jgi:hypothetical protein
MKLTRFRSRLLCFAGKRRGFASSWLCMQKSSFITTFVFAFALVGCSRSETSPPSSNDQDRPGWQTTRWGMTADEIRKAMPEAGPLDKTETFEPVQGHKKVATLGINRFQIADHTFTVYFLMDDNDRLERVILSPIKGQFPSIVFDSLENLLTAKYGKPSITRGEGSRERTDVWHLSGMTITLNYYKEESIAYELANLVYSKPQKTELDKL